MLDYKILGVAYDESQEDGHHIAWLYIARKDEGEIKGGWIVASDFVYDLINTKTATFTTMFYNNSEKKLNISGASVSTYGEKYLRTDPDSTDSNNLESLPVFEMPDREIENNIVKWFEKFFLGATKKNC